MLKLGFFFFVLLVLGVGIGGVALFWRGGSVFRWFIWYFGWMNSCSGTMSAVYLR